MKERVIILAEGGACGHFICTLLQTLHVPNIFSDLKIPKHGSMDLIASAGSLTHKYLINEKQFTIYPEREEAMEVLMYSFNNPESTYKPYQDDYEKEYHEVHVIHYQRQENINKLLALPDTKIIFVKYESTDHRRIAVNKVSKNFAIDAMATNEFAVALIKKHYGKLLRWAEFNDAADELDALDHASNISKSLVKNVTLAWEKYIEQRGIHNSPTPHKNLLILNFNDLYFNKEIIMKSLSEFVGLPINDSTKLLYDDYLSKQPNIDLY